MSTWSRRPWSGRQPQCPTSSAATGEGHSCSAFVCSARDASSMGEGHVDGGKGHAQGPRVHAAERANQLRIVVEVLKAALGVVVVADMR